MLKHTIIASLLTFSLVSISWSQEGVAKGVVTEVAADSIAEAKSTQAGELININTASADELASLSNIGLKKALKIVEYRQLNGLFSTVDDLQNVKGIGPSIIEKNRNRLLVAN